MKRYLVLVSEIYYPSSGMGDFINDFDSLEEAKLVLHEQMYGQIDHYIGVVWDSEIRENVYEL